jgi:hypothetical protein
MGDVVNFLLEPSNRMFTGAFVVLLVLLSLEVITMLIGASLSAILDSVSGFNSTFDFDISKPDFSISKPDFDISKPDISKPDLAVHGFMGWLNAGHVPLLILIIAFLGGFAASGLTIQWIYHSVLAGFLPALVVAPISVIFTLPIVRSTSNVVGKLFPQDNTNAITTDKLIGHYGTVCMGPASKERPGQAKVTDDYGTAHYVRIVPEGLGIIEQGASVVLLERLTDDTFLVRQH